MEAEGNGLESIVYELSSDKMVRVCWYGQASQALVMFSKWEQGRNLHLATKSCMAMTVAQWKLFKTAIDDIEQDLARLQKKYGDGVKHGR